MRQNYNDQDRNDYQGSRRSSNEDRYAGQQHVDQQRDFSRDSGGREGSSREGYGRDNYGRDNYGRDNYGRDNYGRDNDRDYDSQNLRDRMYGREGNSQREDFGGRNENYNNPRSSDTGYSSPSGGGSQRYASQGGYGGWQGQGSQRDNDNSSQRDQSYGRSQGNYNQGGSNQSNHNQGGFSGYNQSHANQGNYNQGGSYRYGQSSQGGYGQSNQGGYGQSGYGQSGYGQSNQGGYGQSNQGGYGQSNQGGYGQSNFQNRNQNQDVWNRMEGDGSQRMGRGPKGYQRSDERIREDICDRLEAHGEVDAGEVDVSVQGGEVTLTGTVTRRDAKRLIEDIAESVQGVKEVTNQIRFQRGDSDPQRSSGTSSSSDNRHSRTSSESNKSSTGSETKQSGTTSTAKDRDEDRGTSSRQKNV